MNADAEKIADRIMGAKLVSFEDLGNGDVRIEWEHHGTDMDIGCATVPLAAFCFCDGPACDSCWMQDAQAEADNEAAAQAREP